MNRTGFLWHRIVKKGNFMQRECYCAAVYLRLSREDARGNVLGSNSICSQRDLIDSFVRKQDDIEIYDDYIEK